MERTTKMPRWVKGFVWVGVVVAVLVGAMLASGHGRWEHMNTGRMH